MNKTVKRGLLIAAGVVAACGVVWGGLTLARNANRGSVNVYAVSDFSMTDYWGDTSQTSGMVSTDDIQKLYLSDTQKVNKVYVQEGQTVRKGDKLLSYDTTLTSLDVERAQIAYDKQQYELEKAQKEFQRLLKAKDKEKLEEEIKELQDKIDELRKAKQQDIFNRDSEAIDRIETVDKLEPLKSPAGDGSKESPLYFNWNSQDEMTPENLAKLLPEGKATAYVVLVIHENDQTLGQIVNCCGLRLEWVNPTGGSTGGETGGTGETGGNTGTEPGGEGSDPATQTGEGGMVLPVMPAEEKKDTVKVFPAKLTEAPQIDIDGTTDEVLELEDELEELQKIADKAYTAEELPRMIGEKYMAIQEMDRAIKLAKLNLDQVKKEVGSDTVYSELDGTIKAVRDSNSARRAETLG